MGKLRIAVIMEDCLPTEGGGYSYYQTLLSAIDKYQFHEDIEIINLDFYDSAPASSKYNKQVIRVKKSVLGDISYQLLNLLYKSIHYILKTNSKPYLELIARMKDAILNRTAMEILVREKIHLVYYLKPKDNLMDYPMIVTHWDVGHKSMYPFPEVAWNGNYEKREKYYSEIVNKAFLILCESETGAKELQHFYPLNPARVKVMPFFSGELVTMNVTQEERLQIIASYNLTVGRYFVYPAQFWAHKNHSTLIDAFSQLRKEQGNESLKLVLCGGDQGNLTYIQKLVADLNLNGIVIMPGFISNVYLYSLYKHAIALVMPTFLGPTNIPLIEAAQLKCAVICSQFDGHREIMGDNALYFNPADADDIKNCMTIILQEDLRSRLIAAAYQHITKSPFQVEKSIPLLDRFLQQLKPVRTTWGMGLKFLFAFAHMSHSSFN